MRLGLLSDAHGHTAALRRAISLLQREGAERLLFLGDAVGYIPDPEAVRVIVDEGIAALGGNHEDMLLHLKADDERQAIYRHGETARSLAPELRAALEQWPSQHVFQHDGIAIKAVHGSVSDPLCGYVYPDADLSPWADPRHQVILMGHTHYPFVRVVQGVLFVNPGSCGLPRDTGGFASVAILDTELVSARILRFDIRDLAEQVIERFRPHDKVISALRREPSMNFVGEVVDV